MMSIRHFHKVNIQSRVNPGDLSRLILQSWNRISFPKTCPPPPLSDKFNTTTNIENIVQSFLLFRFREAPHLQLGLIEQDRGGEGWEGEGRGVSRTPLSKDFEIFCRLCAVPLLFHEKKEEEEGGIGNPEDCHRVWTSHGGREGRGRAMSLREEISQDRERGGKKRGRGTCATGERIFRNERKNKW